MAFGSWLAGNYVDGTSREGEVAGHRVIQWHLGQGQEDGDSEFQQKERLVRVECCEVETRFNPSFLEMPDSEVPVLRMKVVMGMP